MVGKGPPQHLDFTSIIAYLTEKLYIRSIVTQLICNEEIFN